MRLAIDDSLASGWGEIRSEWPTGGEAPEFPRSYTDFVAARDRALAIARPPAADARSTGTETQARPSL